MRFPNPDVGEALDRLTILARKRLEKPAREHYKIEEAALIQYLGTMNISMENLPALLRFAAVNAAIWETESDIRYNRKLIDLWGRAEPNMKEKLADLAIRLQSMNEERARLVKFFSEKFRGSSGEEKVFAL